MRVTVTDDDGVILEIFDSKQDPKNFVESVSINSAQGTLTAGISKKTMGDLAEALVLIIGGMKL